MMIEVSAPDLERRIRDALRMAGRLSASSLRHRVERADEFPVSHEQLYGSLVRMEAEGIVRVTGGYRPVWEVA